MPSEKTTINGVIAPDTGAKPGRMLPWVAGVGVLLTLGVAWFSSARVAYSTAFGVVVALVNLAVMIKVVGVLLDGSRRRVLWGLLAAAKLGALGLLLFFVFGQGYCDPLGFAMGYASLPFGVIVAQALGALEYSTVDRALGPRSR